VLVGVAVLVGVGVGVVQGQTTILLKVAEPLMIIGTVVEQTFTKFCTPGDIVPPVTPKLIQQPSIV
jgi:hypothetical protein